MQSSYPPAMAQFSSMGSVPSTQMPGMSRQMQQISMDSYNVNLVSNHNTLTLVLMNSKYSRTLDMFEKLHEKYFIDDHKRNYCIIST